MFGYIAPLKNELKIKELAEYKAFYCGLCKAIGIRYGQLPRLALSYDCSYIAILLSGLYECKGFYQQRCAYKLLEKPKMIARASSAMDFAADMDILLSWYKMEDDWIDERKLLSLGAKSALSSAAKRAKTSSPRMAEAISSGIAQLSVVERAKNVELDAAAHVFASMMSAILQLAPVPDERARLILTSFGYNIGRWLYLADAWDDRVKDKKSNAYNPFNITECDSERAEFALHYSLNEAIKAYELLEIKSHRGLLDNVIYDGCVAKTISLVGGNNE
ncbi:MAG: DUF5685 family protein [Clostridia bacterium]